MQTPTTSDLYSIGDAASSAGISPATLRMWERRYGRPVPVRLPSGHRRFTAAQVRWLRRVAEALARGVRTSQAVRATDEELDALLCGAAGEACIEVRRLVRLAQDIGSGDLAGALAASCEALGPQEFLTERVAPFVVELGRAWADGQVAIRHEHGATEQVDALLGAIRRAHPAPPGAPTILLTTLPEESHALGLQMVAAMAAIEGVGPRVLGTGTPIAEIAAAARETGADAVGISVSLATGGPCTDRVLAELRRLLPEPVRLVVGGAGARGVRRGPRSIEYVRDLAAMATWLAELRDAARATDVSGPPAESAARG